MLQLIREPDQIFSFIKFIADDPINEMYGRNIWSRSYVRSSNPYVIQTRCFYTYKAIMIALFGNTLSSCKKVDNIFKFFFSFPLNRVVAVGVHLIPTTFYDYATFTQGTWGGHGFVVIKYVTQKGEPRFRLFQSFLCLYSLREWMDKGLNDMSWSEFSDFINKLNEFVTQKEMRDDFFEFHKKYFGAPIKDVKPGWKSFAEVPMSIIGGDVTMQKIHEHQEAFHNFRQYIK